MRVVVVGQRAFGAAVLEAFALRGHEVVGAFVPPAEGGARADPLREAAIERGIRVHALTSSVLPEAEERLREAAADIAVMAFVTIFVPQSFCRIPKHGTIQFHPSLLPGLRGPSAVNWAIIRGCAQTGVSIFRPVDGLDEGPVILQRAVDIGADDTAGTLYFGKLFPLGVEALVEAAALVASGGAVEVAQSASEGSYEGWVREAESQIHWATHVDQIHDLIRGCDPAPGAWTWLDGKRLRLFGAAKSPARSFAATRGKVPGTITAVSTHSFTVYVHGGFIEVRQCQLADQGKISAGELGLRVGTRLGDGAREENRRPALSPARADAGKPARAGAD